MNADFSFPDAAVLVFCKAPLAGKVKTRLLEVLTPAQAAALHARLAHTLVAQLASARLAPLHLYCHPDPSHPFFRALKRRYRVGLCPQRGADLGERMLNAFQKSLTALPAALAVGCDCPSLTPNDLHTTLKALAQGFDVVLGPAEDGGYVLIGLRRAWPELFLDMPWGSTEVLAETRRRIETLGLKSSELPLQWDLDRPQDLQRWQRTCQRSTTWRRR